MSNTYLYLIIKIISLLASGSLLIEGTKDAGSLIVGLLAFCCLFLIQFLLTGIRQGRWERTSWVLMAASLGGCIALGAEKLFPMLLIIVWELLEFMAKGRMFYQLAAVSGVLLYLIYPPGLYQTVIAFLTGGMLCMLRQLNRQLIKQKDIILTQKEELAQASRKTEDIKNYVKTIRNAVSMEERNRFAAKIHDQLGHTISGSIILLEATVLSLDKDPEAARKNIRTVADNLRRGVDDIRHSLRQERPDRSRLGIGEIRRYLEEFKVTYGIETSIEIQGDMEGIASPLWICIRENLKEVLTNVLKHSSGDAFYIKINSMNKILRVEYGDNGEAAGDIAYGIGLSAIEERTASCGGRCIVHGGHGGFVITTIFTDK